MSQALQLVFVICIHVTAQTRDRIRVHPFLLGVTHTYWNCKIPTGARFSYRVSPTSASEAMTSFYTPTPISARAR